MQTSNIPHSIEAEQSVLGGLLIDNGAIDRIGDLPESAFFSLAHRLIYRAIRKQAGKGWDVITVCEMLESAGKMNEAGGFAYIGSLAQNVPSSANIGRYAEIVRDHAVRREIMAAAAEISEIASSKGDVSEAMNRMQSVLISITNGASSDDPRSISEVINSHFDILEKRLSTEKRGITTGLTDLDAILNGGWHRGQSVVIAGRPGHGKTAESMHHALSAAEAGYGVLYLSMEMTASELADRAIAAAGRVHLGNLLTGKLSESEWGGVTSATGKFQDMPLHILDKSGLTFFQVATFARRHKRKHGLDLMVLDYLQLMSGGSDDKRHTQIEEITRNLKSLAKELNIAILLLSQLSRKSENARRPKLSDLRDSSSVEQDADVILFIHREEADDPDTQYKNYADIHIAKNRQGALGRIGVTYIGSHVRFENYAGALPSWDNKTAKRGFEE